MYFTAKEREYSRNLTWDHPKVSWGPVLCRDSYPEEGDWGLHGVEIRILQNVEVFSDSPQVVWNQKIGFSILIAAPKYVVNF